jgi:hypothetical protein
MGSVTLSNAGRHPSHDNLAQGRFSFSRGIADILYVVPVGRGFTKLNSVALGDNPDIKSTWAHVALQASLTILSVNVGITRAVRVFEIRVVDFAASRLALH